MTFPFWGKLAILISNSVYEPHTKMISLPGAARDIKHIKIFLENLLYVVLEIQDSKDILKDVA